MCVTYRVNHPSSECKTCVLNCQLVGCISAQANRIDDIKSFWLRKWTDEVETRHIHARGSITVEIECHWTQADQRECGANAWYWYLQMCILISNQSQRYSVSYTLIIFTSYLMISSYCVLWGAVNVNCTLLNDCSETNPMPVNGLMLPGSGVITSVSYSECKIHVIIMCY